MRSVRKSFGATAALAGVDLTVQPGEVRALIGENGAGKSTLMKILAGAIPSDAGEMTLLGAPFRPNGPFSARRAGIAMIYQELNLAPQLNIAENIFLGTEGTALSLKKGDDEKLCNALDLLGLGHLSPKTIVGSLNIGTQQMIEIARAIVSEAQKV